MVKCIGIQQDDIFEVELNKFTKEDCLAWVLEDVTEDEEDNWSVLVDEKVNGYHCITIGEEIEGDTFKFIYKR